MAMAQEGKLVAMIADEVNFENPQFYRFSRAC